MAISEFETKKHEKALKVFIEKHRPPVHIRKEVDLGFKLENQSIEIFEIRPKWDNPKEKTETPVAKTTYIKASKIWKLYWQRADLKWHSYQPYPQGKNLEEILDVIGEDKNACFWG
jgi:hypothetical protein